MPINSGFTGTRHGMNDKQLYAMEQMLLSAKEKYSPLSMQFHHGDCVGADMEAAQMARDAGYYIVGWPPNSKALRGFFKNDKTNAPMQYLERDRIIVELADLMYAAPLTKEYVVGSGTWYTIRYAEKMYTGSTYHRLLIVDPDFELPSCFSFVAKPPTQMVQ